MALETAAAEILKSLFGEVCFHIVPSPILGDQGVAQITSLLVENGGKQCQPREATFNSHITIDFEEVTHIIAADNDFPGYNEAESLMIPVVKPEWIHASIQMDRVAHVRPFTPNPRFFFSGVMATVADLPVGDKEAICGGIIAMGGQFSNHLTKFTTHIVALNMDNGKCKQAIAKKLNVQIVLPHWFDDCLKLAKRINEGPYTLPIAELELLDPEAPLVIPEGPDLSYSHPHKNGPMSEDPPSEHMSTSKIFYGKTVALGVDLGISERLFNVISDLIIQAKGTVSEDVEKAHIYIGQFRDGDGYIRACQRGLTVGSLTWLYWMFAHGRWSNPLNRLLHYPLVRGGLPEMKSYVITVSNYGGDARLYLETLIEACGAKFTKSMKVDNTHLITARAQSEKYVAAQEWNINIVNHLWLEDTYAKWAVQSLTNARYTHFPRRTNLMEIVGQTQIDRNSFESFYKFDEMDVDPEPLQDEGTTLSNNRPLNVVRTNAAKPSALTVTPKNKRLRNETLLKTVTPLLSSGRKAKEQAVARLHDEIMPDMNLYQKEQKRKGGVIGSRKRRSNISSPDETIHYGGPRTTSPEYLSSNEDCGKNKKSKKRIKPTMFLLMTAYKGWLDQPHKEEKEKRLLADLGIKCVTEPSQCTHLAAPHLVRTEKFICALARAPIIVSTDWVEVCVQSKKIIPTDSYLLKDSEGEARLNVNLESSLSRAKENKGQLLEGITINCAPGVHGGFEICKRIVEANGGICVSLRAGKRPVNSTHSKPMVLLSGDELGDRKLWPQFRKMAGPESLIYKADWLLDLAMSQTVNYGKKYEISAS